MMLYVPNKSRERSITQMHALAAGVLVQVALHRFVSCSYL
jgi:hypothetical protein